MDRRGFLTRSGLALGALVVGDAALEQFERMTHVRKSFPSGAVGCHADYIESFLMHGGTLPSGDYRLKRTFRFQRGVALNSSFRYDAPVDHYADILPDASGALSDCSFHGSLGAASIGSCLNILST